MICVRLLILDNFEQIVATAPLVLDILVSCPNVKVLVTSRAALHVRGEQEFAIPPLDIPDLKHLPELERGGRPVSGTLATRRGKRAARLGALAPASRT